MPVELREVAWIAGNGEPAWSAQDALAAARWLTEHGLAIVGLEVYEQLPETEWGSFRDDWSVTPAAGGEVSWAAWVQRCFAEAAGVIESLPASERPLKVYFAVASSTEGRAPGVAPVRTPVSRVQRVRRGYE